MRRAGSPVIARVLGILLALGGCVQSPNPAPVSAAAPSPPMFVDPEPAERCIELPSTVPRELDRRLELTPCTWTLDPPAFDRDQRARARETIESLDPADPTSLQLAQELAFDELAAADWEGLDDPAVHTRLRATLDYLEPIVHAPEHVRAQVCEEGLMAMMCMHAILGEAAPAQARALELLDSYGHGGPSRSRLYLMQAGLHEDAGQQDAAIVTYERAVQLNALDRYAVYRLAWALRHPAIVDEVRSVALLEQLLDDIRREPILDAPRLDRALAYRAAMELRALGREVMVPPLGCLTAG